MLFEVYCENGEISEVCFFSVKEFFTYAVGSFDECHRGFAASRRHTEMFEWWLENEAGKRMKRQFFNLELSVQFGNFGSFLVF